MKLPSLGRRSLLLGLAGLGSSLPVAAGAAPQKQQPARPAPRAQGAAKPTPAAPPPPPVPTTTASGYPWIDTAAEFAYIIDANTGAVLLDKRANDRMIPSSMTKMMTAYIVFDKLQKGELRMTDQFAVSEDAWRRGGAKTDSSTMYLELASRPTVEQLVQGMIVQSGNDACIVLAEGISGTEEAFAEEMNKRAKAMGLRDTNFRNSTGYPDPDHWSTAHDLAILAKHSISDHPEFYKYYSEKEYTYNGIRQDNRLPLLYKSLGVDGLKTGHTQAAGYGLTISAVREGGRRIIVVLNGLTSMKARGQEAERLLDWAYREFENVALFKAGDTVEKADVWLGEQKTVNLVPQAAVVVTVPRLARRDLKVVASYDNPLQAPLVQGQVIGHLNVTAPTTDPIQVPLVAGEAIGRLGVFGRMTAAASYLLFGNGTR